MKLPTNEEIKKESLRVQSNNYENEIRWVFITGAIWMRDTYAKTLAEENEGLILGVKDFADLNSNLIFANQKLTEQLRIAVEALETFCSMRASYHNARVRMSKEALYRIKSLGDIKNDFK